MAASLQLLARQISPPMVADGELLDRFTHTRDNEAFSELVRRHGPVVYRICRRLVGTAAADDAFQATFLLLATRTTAAKAATSVGGWLVGVAGRVARQIRRAAQRREHHESTAACQTRVESTDSTPELLDQFRILDEELASLPDRLRDPLVSCLLQGRTQEEAAAESGHTTRTVRRRLEEAKRFLRIRLLRRGVTPAVATGFVAGLASVSTAVPVGLATRTVAVVFDFLTGGPTLSSPPVLLAKGVATTMLARKLKTLMVVVAFGLTSLGFVLAEDPNPSPNPTAAKVVVAQPLPVQALPALPAPKQLAQNLKPGEQQVMISALCVQMSAGFCEECGLMMDRPTSKAGEKSGSIATSLSSREARMLKALIRIRPDRDILTRPQMSVADGQTAFAQVGTNYPAETDAAETSKDGKTVSTPDARKVLYAQIGVVLKITPKIGKDGRSVTLDAELGRGEAVKGQIEVPSSSLGFQDIAAKTQVQIVRPGKGVEGPAFIQSSLRKSVVVPVDGMAVIGGSFQSGSKGEEKTEMLWLLTPQVIQPK